MLFWLICLIFPNHFLDNPYSLTILTIPIDTLTNSYEYSENFAKQFRQLLMTILRIVALILRRRKADSKSVTDCVWQLIFLRNMQYNQTLRSKLQNRSSKPEKNDQIMISLSFSYRSMLFIQFFISFWVTLLMSQLL